MSYPGGKAGSGIAQRQINLIPPHKIWVTGFAGHCAVTLMKKPAPIDNIIVDKDEECLNHIRTFMPDITHPTAITCWYGDFLGWWDMNTPKLREITKPGEVFIYLDPPYLATSTRPRYKHQFNVSLHEYLLRRVVDEKHFNVMICGYPNSLYNHMLGLSRLHTGKSPLGWTEINYEAWTRGAKFKTEALYLNYNPPVELHDYAHLGADFRSRERIRKKQRRWLAKFDDLPLQEKYAILEQMKERMNL